MTNRSLIRRNLFGCAAIVAVSGLLVAGSSCSPPQQLGVQTAPAAAQGEMKTVAVIAVNSYEKLMGDVNFLGSLVGMAGADQIAQASLLSAIGDNGLATIDKTKPWGVILQTDGANFQPLGAIPVTKTDDFLAIVKANGIQVNEQPDGSRLLSLPNGMPLFVKPQAGWTIIGASPQAFAAAPANIEAELSKLVTDYDLAATLAMQQVPEMYRQLIIGWMRSGMQQAMQQKPDETAEQYAMRQQTADAQLKEMEQFLSDAAKLTFGMGVDGKQQRGYFDVVIEAVPGTRLAKQISASADPHTNFAGFFQTDAAATVNFVNQMDPESLNDFIAQMRANMNSMRQQLNAAIDEDASIPAGMRDAVKSAAGDFADAMVATIETGKLDGAATLRVRPETLTFVGGTKLKNPDSVVNGLKKLEAAGKESMPGFPAVQWNAAEHAGVKVHTLNVPLPPEADESLRKMVGDQLPIAVGVGPESVFLAFGRDHLEALNRAIDGSAKEANKPVPPMEVALSLGPIMELAAAHTTDVNISGMLQQLAAMLQNDAQGRDHIRILGQIVPNGMRYRFEAEEGALRAIGQAAFIARMQGMGQ